VNAVFAGYNGLPEPSRPYPSRNKYPLFIPVFPPDLTNMNKSPPRISTILPMSLVFTPRFLNFELVALFVSDVAFPFKNSPNVSKNATTWNPCPAGPVVPVSPVGPRSPVIPLPVGPVLPIGPWFPTFPFNP
jgi:hypothetical protein